MSFVWMIPSNHLILCHPLLPPALTLSQHQGLFQLVGSSHQVAKVLELQPQSFQCTEYNIWLNLKNNRMFLVCFQSKPFNIIVIQVYAPTTDA